MKFQEWLPEWLEYYVKPSAKEKTLSYYSLIVYRHLIPDVGSYEMEMLTPLVLQKYITKLLREGNLRTGKGLAVNTVQSIISVIQCATKQAYEVGNLSVYTSNKIKRPKGNEKRLSCFSVEEQKKIELAVMKDSRKKMFGIILSLYTGLRIGELLALEWTNIDFEKSELAVLKNCHDGKKDGKYCRLYNTPKTESGERIIPIPRQLLPYLAEMRIHGNSQWVIENGNKIVSIRSYQYSFSLLLKKLNIPHRGFHVLRHVLYC